MTKTIYEHVAAKRKNWTPINPTKNEVCTPGTEGLLSKALCFRFLEMPVFDFITEGLSRPEAQLLGDEGKEALLRNTEDEVRHDEALNNCVRVFEGYQPEHEKTIQDLVKQIIDHPDHPILKAAVLENGVFFLILPLFRRFGGEALRITSMDVSADEINHVQLHRYAARLFGQKPSKSLDNLRRVAINWLVEGFLGVDELTADTLRAASDDLMYKGITKRLDFSRSYQVPAFFERRNDTLPYYN